MQRSDSPTPLLGFKYLQNNIRGDVKFFKRTKERLMMFLPVTLPSVDVEQLCSDKF